MYQRSQRSHDETIFQMILIISAASVVNDEIIFNVVLLSLGNVFLKYSWNWWSYFLCTVVSKVSVASVVSDESVSGIQNQCS